MRGQETGNPNRVFFPGSVICSGSGGSVRLSTGRLSVALRCGTLTLNMHPAQHREACFKRVQIAEIPAAGTPQYNTYTCVGGRAGLQVETSANSVPECF